MKKGFVLLVFLAVLISFAVPTKYQPQNRLFEVCEIRLREDGDGAVVSQLLKAHNPFPWTVTITDVYLRARGEYNLVHGSVEADLPIVLQGWEEREIQVQYPFDKKCFLTEFAADFGTKADECIESFLRSDGFSYNGKGILNGSGQCFAENHYPVYVVEQAG